MKHENLIKFAIIMGGGFGIFWLLKMAKEKNASKSTSTSSNSTTGFDSSKPQPKTENADLVATAYSDAVKAGEPSSRLTELNKELMKEFGMRCYIDKDSKLIVVDSKGNTIITK
jgi:hypothetical protein